MCRCGINSETDSDIPTIPAISPASLVDYPTATVEITETDAEPTMLWYQKLQWFHWVILVLLVIVLMKAGN